MFSKPVVHVFVCIVAFYTMNCLVVLLLQLCYNHMFCIWEYLFLSPALSNANTNQLRTYSFMEDIDLFSILFLPLLRRAPANPYYLLSTAPPIRIIVTSLHNTILDGGCTSSCNPRHHRRRQRT